MPNTARLREELSLTDDVLARFFEKHVVHESGCWLWTAAKSGTGYGKFRVGKRSFDAHVISWRIANGGEPVPVGKLVMHSCDVRGCVNPAHLSIPLTVLGSLVASTSLMISIGKDLKRVRDWCNRI